MYSIATGYFMLPLAALFTAGNRFDLPLYRFLLSPFFSLSPLVLGFRSLVYRRTVKPLLPPPPAQIKEPRLSGLAYMPTIALGSSAADPDPNLFCRIQVRNFRPGSGNS
jgi:hypothetical protein